MVSSAVCRFKPSVGLPDAAETVVLWDSTNGGRVSGLPHRDRFVADIYCSHAGTATAEWSVDRGATWVAYDSVSVSAWAAGSQNLVEFAVGEYRDVRVSFTSGDDAQTTFLVLACLTDAGGSAATLDALPAQLVPGATTITGTGRPASVTVDGYVCTVEYTGATWSAVVPAGVPEATMLGLGQTARAWYALASLGDDVYATVFAGSVYKQTGSSGDFATLEQATRNWSGITSDGADVYATTYAGDVYKQTGGAGDFVALGQTSRNWYGIAPTGNDLRAVVSIGDIYQRTGGAGDFVASGGTVRAWRDIVSYDGDVYATVYGGDIYKQEGGAGAFVGTGQTARNWFGLAEVGGDLYATTYGDDIYQRDDDGVFVALRQGARNWVGTTDAGPYLYAATSDDIYRARVLVDVALDGVVAGSAPVSWRGILDALPTYLFSGIDVIGGVGLPSAVTVGGESCTVLDDGDGTWSAIVPWSVTSGAVDVTVDGAVAGSTTAILGEDLVGSGITWTLGSAITGARSGVRIGWDSTGTTASANAANTTATSGTLASVVTTSANTIITLGAAGGTNARAFTYLNASGALAGGLGEVVSGFLTDPSGESLVGVATPVALLWNAATAYVAKRGVVVASRAHTSPPNAPITSQQSQVRLPWRSTAALDAAQLLALANAQTARVAWEATTGALALLPAFIFSGITRIGGTGLPSSVTVGGESCTVLDDGDGTWSAVVPAAVASGAVDVAVNGAVQGSATAIRPAALLRASDAVASGGTMTSWPFAIGSYTATVVSAPAVGTDAKGAYVAPAAGNYLTCDALAALSTLDTDVTMAGAWTDHAITGVASVLIGTGQSTDTDTLWELLADRATNYLTALKRTAGGISSAEPAATTSASAAVLIGRFDAPQTIRATSRVAGATAHASGAALADPQAHDRVCIFQRATGADAFTFRGRCRMLAWFSSYLSDAQAADLSVAMGNYI